MLLASVCVTPLSSGVLALALALSVIGLSLGPLLNGWARGRERALAVLDAATLALVPGVILLRLLPHLIEDAGGNALIGFACGYVVLLLVEATSHTRAATFGFAVVLPVLAIHAFFDGASLAVAIGNDTLGMGSAVLVGALLVHRIPEGLFLASAMSEIGARRARWGLAAIGAATIVGGLAGRELVDHRSGDVLHIAVAIGLGAMLRLVVHRHDVSAFPDRVTSRLAGITFVVGVVLVVFVPDPRLLWHATQPHELSIGEALVPLFLETAPIVLGMLLLAELGARALRTAATPTNVWAPATVLGIWVIGPCLAILGAVSAVVVTVVYRRRSGSWWQGLLLPRATSVLPSYCLGVVLAVVAEAALPVASFEDLGIGCVPVAAVIGSLVELGVGAPLIAAILVHKGAPLSAVVAFLIAAGVRGASPGSLYHRMAAAAVATVGAVVLTPLVSRCDVPGLHDLARHSHRAVEWITMTMLGAWIVIDLARFGPRRWLHGGVVHQRERLMPPPDPSLVGGDAPVPDPTVLELVDRDDVANPADVGGDLGATDHGEHGPRRGSR